MTTDKPSADGHIIHLDWDNGSVYASQLFIPNNLSGNIQYRVQSSSTTWSGSVWKQVWTENNLSAMTQSEATTGTATSQRTITAKVLHDTITGAFADYVVEQGTSGIWNYRKWNSGYMEAWGASGDSVAMTTANGNLYFGNTDFNISGLGFTSISNIQVTGQASNYYTASKVDRYSTSSITVSDKASGSYTTTVIHFIEIKGRWK